MPLSHDVTLPRSQPPVFPHLCVSCLKPPETLLAAVFLAYSQHRPLVLTPDAVWLTIAQGVAHHKVVHADRLRPRL